MQIRLIRETELWNAMNLCYRIFMQQVAPRYSPEGIKNFEDFLLFEKQLTSLLLFGPDSRTNA